MKRKYSRKYSRKEKRMRKCPFCSRKFRGGAPPDTVVKTIYTTGNPDTALSQAGAKATLNAMNSMMK